MRETGEQITLIKPNKGWRFVDVKEIMRFKDLLLLLSLRGIKTKYAQSVLGVGWAVIQPIMTTLVLTIVFGKVAKVNSDGSPYFLFSLVAMVPWNYFSGTLNESSASLVANANLINKVYFPRILLPLSAAISKGLDLIIGFILLILFLLIYGYYPNWTIVFLPLLLLILLMTSLGLGMILSALAIQYRDVRHAMTFMIQLLMYAAPVVYSTSNVPEQYRTLYALNPMVGVIEGFRSIFLGSRSMPLNWIIIGLMVSAGLFVFASMYFRKMERVFADVA